MARAIPSLLFAAVIPVEMRLFGVAPFLSWLKGWSLCPLYLIEYIDTTDTDISADTPVNNDTNRVFSHSCTIEADKVTNFNIVSVHKHTLVWGSYIM